MAGLLRAAYTRFARALRQRDFARYVGGNSANLIGVWMQRIAIGWLTWQLTHSGAWLGVIAVADLAPTVIVGPLAGALADRADLLRLAKLTQALALVQTLVLALLALAGLLTIGLLVVLTLIQGVIFAFWQPVRLALIAHLVPAGDLASAVAINSVVFNTARFIGPALAGVLLIAANAGWVFVLNALTSFGFLYVLRGLRLPARASLGRRQERFMAEIGAGYRYVARQPGMAPILLVLAASCVWLRPVFELLPGFAAQVFGRGPEGLSALAAVTGVGAMLGGFWLGQRDSLLGLTRLVMGSVLALALALLLFCVSQHFYIALLCLGAAGAAATLSGAGGQTLLQTATAAHMRGRVLALFGMIVRAGPALGALLMGGLSDVVGLRWPLAAGCGLGLLVCAWAYRHLTSMAAALEAPQR